MSKFYVTDLMKTQVNKTISVLKDLRNISGNMNHLQNNLNEKGIVSITRDVIIDRYYFICTALLPSENSISLLWKNCSSSNTNTDVRTANYRSHHPCWPQLIGQENMHVT